MERWGIDLSKEYLKFSAAHFLIFSDGTSERLHGHNYRVFVDLEANLDEFGLVIDFKRIKPVVRELCDELDEHWLVPAQHPVLRYNEREDGVTEVHYKDLYYAAPTGDVILLPVNNTSSENLAAWVGRELHRRLQERFSTARIEKLRVAVEETHGQRGVYLFTRDD